MVSAGTNGDEQKKELKEFRKRQEDWWTLWTGGGR